MAKVGTSHPAIAGSAAWQSATREYVERLRKHYGERLAAVVLYGSRARGDADEGSDVDLLVVLCGDLDLSAEQRFASELSRDIEERYNYVLLGPIVAPERDYRHRMLPLFINIRREGIEIWPTAPRRIEEERGEYGASPAQEVDTIMAFARDALADAEFGLEHARHRWTANRAYYAMFHAATALLLNEGLAFSKHRGVIGAFHGVYVKTGRFPIALGQRLDDAFTSRNIADYSYREAISADLAAQLVDDARAFIAEAETILSLKTSE